jgi:hydrogenase maturation protein HypF
MLARGVHSPWTSSVGRLFDAVAAIVGLRGRSRYEGQAAMELEYAVGNLRVEEAYAFEIESGHGGIPEPPPLTVDWEKMIRAVLDDVRRDVATARIAARFHNTLAEIIVEVARRAGEERIVLTGGCFQNRYLTERTVRRLRAEGFRPYWHQRIPPNDGGLALGQVWAASRAFESQGDASAIPPMPMEAAR